MIRGQTIIMTVVFLALLTLLVKIQSFFIRILP